MTNGNGKEITLSVSKSLNQRLENYAEEQEKSVQTVAREAIEGHLDKCDLKSVIKEACEEGKLREDSKACTVEHS